MVEKEGQRNLRIRAAQVSHQVKAVPSGVRGRPCDQTSYKTSEPVL